MKRPSTCPPSDAATVRLGRSRDPQKAARTLHASVVPGAVYTAALKQRVTAAMGSLVTAQDGMDYAKDVFERMAPRDPAEEMLVAQLLVAHARVLHLTSLANHQTTLEAIRTINEYADRASNAYRRLVLALAEYRRPPRAGDSFTAIRQANFAGQQVVQNHENSNPKATNKQGCQPSAGPPALPAEPEWAGGAPGIHPAREAVDMRHRAVDGSGQGSLQPERPGAR